MANIKCIDLFCGAGGMTHGFLLEEVHVVAGVDLDPACRFPYESNNNARFIEKNICDVTVEELKDLYGPAKFTVLAGCAPCQPFSVYTLRYGNADKDKKWSLLYEFSRLAQGLHPDIITMENVPNVADHRVFQDFVTTLMKLKYNLIP